MDILHAHAAFPGVINRRTSTSYVHAITGTRTLTSTVPATVHCMYLMQSCRKKGPSRLCRIDGPRDLKEIAGKQFIQLVQGPCRTRSGAAGFAAISVRGKKHPLSALFVKQKKNGLKDLCEGPQGSRIQIAIMKGYNTKIPILNWHDSFGEVSVSNNLKK